MTAFSVKVGVITVVVMALVYVGLAKNASANNPNVRLDTHSSLQLIPRSAATACVANHLKIELADALGAEGTGLYYFTATNTGRSTCTLDGFFGIAIFGSRSEVLSKNDIRSWTTPTGQRVTKRSLALRPQGEVTTTVALGESPTNSATRCPSIETFGLTPPSTKPIIRVARGRNGTGWFCQPKGSGIVVYATTSGSPDIR
jgi:hypothetical protein